MNKVTVEGHGNHWLFRVDGEPVVSVINGNDPGIADVTEWTDDSELLGLCTERWGHILDELDPFEPAPGRSPVIK
jgi:hypothetical protein